jgi:uncharacterized protein YndB with AHSA1/START domain
VTGTDAGARTGSIEVDQFVDADPARVWRTITEPELLARWWAPGDIAPRAGHRFHLDMPGWGAVPCEVLEVVEHERLVYTFTETWLLTWRLVPEGRGTRLLLQHTGFDLEQKRDRSALDRMGPGWRDVVLPRLAEVAAGPWMEADPPSTATAVMAVLVRGLGSGRRGPGTGVVGATRTSPRCGPNPASGCG